MFKIFPCITEVQLQSKGHEFTVKEVINKMKKLREKYKMEKEKSRKSGNGIAKKQWKYFRKIDASNTSLKRGGFRQPRIACSRAYCRRFNACKSGARDDLRCFVSKL